MLQAVRTQGEGQVPNRGPGERRWGDKAELVTDTGDPFKLC